MANEIAPPGFERFSILVNPLKATEKHHTAGMSEPKWPAPVAAAQSTGLRFSQHATGHPSSRHSLTTASHDSLATDQPLFSKSPGEIGGNAVAVAAKLSVGDWVALDASATPTFQETASRYAPGDATPGTVVSVTA